MSDPKHQLVTLTSMALMILASSSPALASASNPKNTDEKTKQEKTSGPGKEALKKKIDESMLPGAQEEDKTVLVHVGDKAPDFTAKTTDGKEFKLSSARGHVVVLDFFATWCPPCRAELPRIEKDLWRRYKNKGLLVAIIGREHSSEELADFQKSKKLTMTVLADPKREVYARYAEDVIPRTFVVDKDGKIIFAEEGYDKPEFKKMQKRIAEALATP